MSISKKNHQYYTICYKLYTYFWPTLYLLRVLCLVRRPVTTLDCILLKDSSLVSAAGLEPEISSQACLWAPVSPGHIVICWLLNQPLIIFFIFCLETLKASSSLPNWGTVHSLASSSAILFPCIPECLETQKRSHRMVGRIAISTAIPMGTLF